MGYKPSYNGVLDYPVGLMVSLQDSICQDIWAKMGGMLHWNARHIKPLLPKCSVMDARSRFNVINIMWPSPHSINCRHDLACYASLMRAMALRIWSIKITSKLLDSVDRTISNTRLYCWINIYPAGIPSVHKKASSPSWILEMSHRSRLPKLKMREWAMQDF